MQSVIGFLLTLYSSSGMRRVPRGPSASGGSATSAISCATISSSSTLPWLHTEGTENAARGVNGRADRGCTKAAGRCIAGRAAALLQPKAGLSEAPARHGLRHHVQASAARRPCEQQQRRQRRRHSREACGHLLEHAAAALHAQHLNHRGLDGNELGHLHGGNQTINQSITCGVPGEPAEVGVGQNGLCRNGRRLRTAGGGAGRAERGAAACGRQPPAPPAPAGRARHSVRNSGLPEEPSFPSCPPLQATQ